MRVELLHLADCPNWEQTLRLLREVLDATGHHDVLITASVIDPGEPAVDTRFAGSPTILVDGTDPFASDQSENAHACRVYVTPDGIAGHPTRAQLEEVIRSHA
ncbi:thioredoxin family protein [Agromyces luteolus]|uniref:Thioredoxin family protein n=1 Tax=Agromyces luteolus TaxID=88373 RepID=A0A7C9LRN9_9MICO|nr:thioredoxin family protein [Agromyces luteolus]